MSSIHDLLHWAAPLAVGVLTSWILGWKGRIQQEKTHSTPKCYWRHPSINKPVFLFYPRHWMIWFWFYPLLKKKKKKESPPLLHHLWTNIHNTAAQRGGNHNLTGQKQNWIIKVVVLKSSCDLKQCFQINVTAVAVRLLSRFVYMDNSFNSYVAYLTDEGMRRKAVNNTTPFPFRFTGKWSLQKWVTAWWRWEQLPDDVIHMLKAWMPRHWGSVWLLIYHTYGHAWVPL